jgi:hypothetical protein
MTNYVRKLLTAAEEQGFKMIVRCEGETDYAGYHAAAAEDAVNAVEECHVRFRDANGKQAGVIFIVNGLDEEERIADSGGAWVESWLQRHGPNADLFAD